jgi:phosphatidate cytidylyltransferase
MVTGSLMVFGFILIIAMGHFYCMLLPLWITITMYRELLNLQRDYEREKKIQNKFFKIITWYYLVLGIFYLYFAFFDEKLLALIPHSSILLFFVKYYRIISFSLYAGGMIMFILSLQSGHYDYQYRIYGWIHLALVLTILCSLAFAGNIYHGMVWFALPGFLIIINDGAAYIFGITFGRTPLISVSPKKTWEGFFGGFICTLITGILVFHCKNLDGKFHAKV